MKAHTWIVLLLIGALFLGGGWHSAAASGASEAAAPLVNCAIVTDITALDCATLDAFYTATGGPGWTDNTGWSDPLSTTACTWFGVSCEADLVSGLVLSNNGLTGSLTPELGNLSGVALLQLDNNGLTGSIPPELGVLTNLDTLDLSNNTLSGPIPTELGNLTALQFLNLSGNGGLTGSIPAGLGSLTDLVVLGLGGNQLSGSIPAGLGSLAELQYLDLSANAALDRGLPQNLTSLVPIPTGVFGFFTFNSTALCEPPDSGFQGWLEAIDPGPGNPSRTNVPCAPVASTVVLTRSTNDLVLTWADQSPNSGYEVYSSGTAPYFTPGAGTLQTTLAQPTATWTNTGAFSDANNYYYVVQSKFQDSVSGSAPWVNDFSADSNRTGKFGFALTPGS